jgi:type IV secretion system protein VirB6
MASTVFTYIGALTDNITSDIASADISTQVSQINNLVLAWFTLYVLAKGYMILAGKSDDPVKDLLFRLSVYGIIVAFATNAGGWLDLASEAINGLNEWASGGSSLYTQLDKAFDDAVQLGIMIEEQEDEALEINIAGFFANVIVLIGFGIFAIPAIGIIITTSFILKILILISPIMIFALLFDWVKGIFQKWIELILSNTLTVLLVGISFNVLTTKYENYISAIKTQAEAVGENGLALSVEIFFVSIVLLLLILMAKGIAQQLTYVSIETLPGSAAKSAGGGMSTTRSGIEKSHGDIKATKDRAKQRAIKTMKGKK